MSEENSQNQAATKKQPENGGDNMTAGLANLPVVSIFLYMTSKENTFLHDNAKQGVALTAILFLAWVFALIIPLFLLVVFAALGCSVAGFLKAKDGNMLVIPILTPYLKKHTFQQMMDEAKQKVESLQKSDAPTTSKKNPENTSQKEKNQ